MFEPKRGARLEIHTLKTHNINYLNRDDMGRLKSMIIGNKTRLRHSSQSIKYAIRNHKIFEDFREYAQKIFDTTTTYRTRLIVRKLKAEIKHRLNVEGLSYEKYETEIETSINQFPSLFLKNGNSKTPEKTTQLLSFTETDIDIIINEIIKIKDRHIEIRTFDQYKKSLALKKLPSHQSIDIPLFGKFSTPNKYMDNIHSPLQVAHSFTVHESQQQRDYWTAADDLTSTFNDTRGSAHLNVRMLGSGVYYSYSCIDILLLAENIKDSFSNHLPPNQQIQLTQDLISAFIFTFLCSGLTGGQTSHANNDLSDLTFITYSGAFPYSAAAAFEKPVQAKKGGGYLEPAKARFRQWLEDREKHYGMFMGTSTSMGLDDEKDTDINSLVKWSIKQITPLITQNITEQ